MWGNVLRRPGRRWLASRARERRPLLFVVLLSAALVWPLARHAVDVASAPGPSVVDQAADSIRLVQRGESIYRSVHGFYDRLECVIQDSCATLNPYPPTYLDARLAWTSRYGYRFRFHDGPQATTSRDGNLSPTAMARYAMTAVPEDSSPKRPAFCGDDRGVLYRLDAGDRPVVESGRCSETHATVVVN